MAAFVRFSIPHRYIGASTDTKPAAAEVGSLCYEYDTGKTYVTYNGAAWTEYAPTTYLNDISAETLTLSGGAGALTFSAAATIVAAAGLTMPAFTLGGAVAGGAQTISNANVTVGASRTLDVSAGTLTLAADQISGDKVEGGTINAITINTLTLGTTLAGADKPFTGLGDFTFTDGSIIATATSDSATIIFKATDNDGAALAQLEVMRLVGANDPYVAFGGSQQSIFYNSGAITIGGNVTFGAGLAIASGSTNGNTLLIKANDTTFLTLTTGATDTLDIGAHNISGDSTVTATKLLTFGNVGTTISDTYVQLSNGSGTAGPKLKYSSAAVVVLRNAADNAYSDLYAGTIRPYGTTLALYFPTTGAEIASRDADDGYAIGKARDNGVGLVEIWRMAGSADPYFSTGGSQQFKFYNSGIADFGGNVAFAAGKTLTGYNNVVENHTAGDTLTLAESGSIHTNYGAGGAVALKLPASATTGTTFKFVVGTAQELRIVVSAAAEAFIVNGGTSTDDGGNDLYLVADDEGEMATFTCIAAGVWLVDVVGTWTPTQP